MDNSNIKIDITADASGMGAGVADAQAKLDNLRQSSYKLASQYSMTIDPIKAHSIAIEGASREVQALMARYDPLGAKLRALQADFANLDKATRMGQLAGQESAVDQIYVKLNQEIAQTKGLMGQAGVAGYESFSKIADGAEKSKVMTAGATRELLILGHEALTGNFSRIPGSLMVMSERIGGLGSLFTAAFTPMGAVVAGITAAVAAGGYVWYEWGQQAQRAADKADEGLKKVTKSADAAQRATRAESLQALNYKIQSEQISARTQAEIAADPNRTNDIRSIAAKTAGEYRREVAGLTRQRDELMKQQPANDSWGGMYATADEKRATAVQKLEKAYQEERTLYAGQTDKLKELADQRLNKLHAIELEYEKRTVGKPVHVRAAAADPYIAFSKQMDERAAVLDAQGNQQEKLTATEQYAAKVMEDLRNGSLKLTEAQKIETAGKLEAMLTQDKINQARLHETAALAAQADVMRSLTGEFDRNDAAQRRAMEVMPEAQRRLGAELDKVAKGADTARVAATKFYTDGKLTADEYFALLQKITDETDRQSGKVQLLAADQDALNKSWEYGAKTAMQKYLDEVGNVAKQTENMMTKAFKGMEDSLVTFVRTGKLDFRSLADSILNDMVRMQIQQSITKPLMEAMSGSGGSGSIFGSIGNAFSSSSMFGDMLFSGGMATGGSFTVGGNGGTDTTPVAFMATPGERVSVQTPGQQAMNSGGNGSGSVQNINISVNVASGTPDAVRRAAGQGAREALMAFNMAGRYA